MPALVSPPPTDANNGPWFIDLDPFMSTGNVQWGNATANFFINSSAYLYGAFHGSDSPGVLNNARWWDLDFGAGGLWDIELLHITGFDVGIYSIRIDDREVGTLDGYSGPDVANLRAVTTGVVIPAGRHRFSLVMNRKNASSTGYYGALHHLFLRRTAVLPQRSKPGAYGAPRGGRAIGITIDICTYMAAGNSSWNTFGGVNVGNLYNGRIDSSGSNGNSRWWYVGVPAGLWDFEVIHVQHSAYGTVAVQVDDVEVGRFDSYGSTDLQARHVIRCYVPTSGKHKIALTVVAAGGGGGFYGGVDHIQLRQVRPQPGSRQSVEPWHHDLGGYFSSGDSHWDTLYTNDNSYLYEGDVESDATVGASRWWYVHMAAGTWDWEMIHATGTNRGIYSLQIDDIEVGTVDGYGAPSGNVHTTTTGIKVARTGKHKVALVMNTKNGSSSNYYGTVTASQLRRTA